MSKSKKTLETSLDLTPSFKTSIDAMVQGLVSNVNNLENQQGNFIQKKYGRNRRLPQTRFILCTVIFVAVRTFYTVDECHQQIIPKLLEGVVPQILQYAHEPANKFLLWLKMLGLPL